MSSVPFSDLSTAAYCPRQLWYRRRDDDRDVPDRVRRVRELAFRYDEVLDGAGFPRRMAVAPGAYRRNLRRARERFPDRFPELRDPAERETVLEGKDCRGVAHKVLDDPPAPSVVVAGDPPDDGVWAPQSVRAVAAAKALAWREETPVDRAFVEYAAHGVVRSVSLTARRCAAYRDALRTVRTLDAPPPRIADDAKCGACDYRGDCGVRTRTLSTLLE